MIPSALSTAIAATATPKMAVVEEGANRGKATQFSFVVTLFG